MARKTVIVHNLKEAKAEVRNSKREKAYEYYSAGKTAYRASKELKLNEKTVYVWYEAFRKNGAEAIEEKPRGPKKRTGAALSPKQFERLEKAVKEKTPDQMKFDFALWSSKAIQEYVIRSMGVEICRRTARRYMRKLGFTYKSPIRRSRAQNQAQVTKWLNEEYPRIKRKARRHGATIMWADETANLAGAEKRAGYSPKGEAPILRAPDQRRIRCSSISAVSNKGDLEFMFFKGGIDTNTFIEFCERLIGTKDKPIYMIVDNLNVHRSKALNSWAEAQNKLNGFCIFYLPSYSPELNPDEYLNRDVKAHLAEKSIPDSAESLQKAVSSHLMMRKADRESVKRLFHKPEVKYAA